MGYRSYLYFVKISVSCYFEVREKLGELELKMSKEFCSVCSNKRSLCERRNIGFGTGWGNIDTIFGHSVVDDISTTVSVWITNPVSNNVGIPFLHVSH